MDDIFVNFISKNGKRILKWGGIAILGIFLFGLLNPIVVIGAGERGVVFNNATGVENHVLSEGVHLRIPFVESVKDISIRVRSSKLDLLAGSQDNNQGITYKVTANWHIEPNSVNTFYQQVGSDDNTAVEAKFISPVVQQAVKNAQAHFDASETLARQLEIKKLVEDTARPELEKYHLILDSITFDDQDFDPGYNAALEARAQARIKADQSVFLKQQAQNEADAKIIEASGSAKSAVIRAQGEADANKLLQLSITPQLLEKMRIDKWKGDVPQTSLGTGTNTLFQIAQ